MSNPESDNDQPCKEHLDCNSDTDIAANSEPQAAEAASDSSVLTSVNADHATKPSDDSSPHNNNLIHPPPSNAELLRDRCLEILGGEAHFRIGIAVAALVVIDGAFFFFLLVGWHNMCDSPSRMDCYPRNDWYNFSIQFLNVLFTYVAIVSLPWKLAHACHLISKQRSSDVGLDLYGQPSDEIWYHICPKQRRWILAILIANSLAQLANQVTRIVYYNYELQSTFPGVLWTNVFFVSSFACGLAAASWQLREETSLRKQRPEDFPPGPLEIAKKYLRAVFCPTKQFDDSMTAEDSEDLENPRPLPEREERARKRCLGKVQRWLSSDKTSLGMWGL